MKPPATSDTRALLEILWQSLFRLPVMIAAFMFLMTFTAAKWLLLPFTALFLSTADYKQAAYTCIAWIIAYFGDQLFNLGRLYKKPASYL